MTNDDDTDQSLENLFQAPRQILRIQAPVIGEVFRDAMSSMNRMGSVVSEAFASLRPMFVEIGEAIRALPARLQENLCALAEEGWYLDPEMDLSDISGIKGQLENGTRSDVQVAMVSYFRAELARIESDLKVRHPRREKLLSTIFSLHRDGIYDAAVPLCFAQTDGIAKELAGREIFGKGIRGSQAAKNLSDFDSALLEPLLRPIPLIYGDQKRGPTFVELNRHAVVHGESLDYGTEQNSLKAISFLNYVSYALSD